MYAVLYSLAFLAPAIADKEQERIEKELLGVLAPYVQKLGAGTASETAKALLFPFVDDLDVGGEPEHANGDHVPVHLDGEPAAKRAKTNGNGHGADSSSSTTARSGAVTKIEFLFSALKSRRAGEKVSAALPRPIIPYHDLGVKSTPFTGLSVLSIT